MTEINSYDPSLLPQGIRSRFIDGVNGLRLHVLEAGYDGENRPCLLLLHGFPELAYSWRRVMPALADAGYHVIAPDQRGYGRTTGWDDDYDGDLRSFRLMNLVTDMLALVFTLGRGHVDAVIGHDFGSHVASQCALIRPDVFRAVALMSAPYGGPPPLSPKPQPGLHRPRAALARGPDGDPGGVLRHALSFRRRQPGGIFLILGNAVADFSGVAEGGSIDSARTHLQDINKSEADGSADNGRCAVRATQHIEITAGANLLTNGVIQNYQNRAAAGTGRCSVQ